MPGEGGALTSAGACAAAALDGARMSTGDTTWLAGCTLQPVTPGAAAADGVRTPDWGSGSTPVAPQRPRVEPPPPRLLHPGLLRVKSRGGAGTRQGPPSAGDSSSATPPSSSRLLSAPRASACQLPAGRFTNPATADAQVPSPPSAVTGERGR